VLVAPKKGAHEEAKVSRGRRGGRGGSAGGGVVSSGGTGHA